MVNMLFRVIKHPKITAKRLTHRVIFWGTAVVVALAAILFAKASSVGHRLFADLVALNALLPFVVTPLGFAAVAWMTRRVFRGAEGSGIPQTIAALKVSELSQRRRILSLRVACGKMVMTTLALCCGASVGREGPTVQIGAAIMHTLGRWLGMPSRELERALILAGGAAGISAAFNTPLAGVVFAIEELSKSFEERTSGIVLTAVIVAGFTSMAILGNYSYFGRTSVTVGLTESWRPVVLCSLVGGVAGGLFSRVLLVFAKGLPGRIGALIKGRPVAFAFLCGLMVALIGSLSQATVHGTGYDEAKNLLEGGRELPFAYGLWKLLATTFSYLSGIPGGIFAPSLATGAGLGVMLSPLAPGSPLQVLAVLGMVGYFTGVVQTPITAVVIVIEMTSNQQLTVPLMAVALMAYVLSKIVCPQPLYRTLAQSFIERTKASRAA